MVAVMGGNSDHKKSSPGKRCGLRMSPWVSYNTEFCNTSQIINPVGWLSTPATGFSTGWKAETTSAIGSLPTYTPRS